MYNIHTCTLLTAIESHTGTYTQNTYMHGSGPLTPTEYSARVKHTRAGQTHADTATCLLSFYIPAPAPWDPGTPGSVCFSSGSMRQLASARQAAAGWHYSGLAPGSVPSGIGFSLIVRSWEGALNRSCFPHRGLGALRRWNSYLQTESSKEEG